MTPDDRVRRAPTAPALPGARRARRQLLLVEDEAALASVLVSVLGAAYQVTVATHGADALRTLDDGPTRFDLVLSDVHMPWMNGIDLHRALVARGSPLAWRFVLMSGAPLSEAHRGYVAAAGLAVIAKPFEMTELERVLDATIAAAVDRA